MSSNILPPPILWYVVSTDIPAGKLFKLSAMPGYPEVWMFSLEAFALGAAELSLYCEMRDFRLWEPTIEDIRRMWRAML